MAKNYSDKPEELVCRAALFGLLSRAFAYPTASCAAEVRELLADLAKKGENDRKLIARRLRGAERAWRAARDQELTDDYQRLFAASGRIPLHETAYVADTAARRAVQLADIAGLYRAFGFDAPHDDPEITDHISAEAAFLSFLLMKEMQALRRGVKGQGRIAGDGVRVFLEYHLGRWINGLARQIGRRRAATPYHELGVLLLAVVAQECRRRHVRPRPFPRRAARAPAHT